MREIRTNKTPTVEILIKFVDKMRFLYWRGIRVKWLRSLHIVQKYWNNDHCFLLYILEKWVPVVIRSETESTKCCMESKLCQAVVPSNAKHSFVDVLLSRNLWPTSVYSSGYFFDDRTLFDFHICASIQAHKSFDKTRFIGIVQWNDKGQF